MNQANADFEVDEDMSCDCLPCEDNVVSMQKPNVRRMLVRLLPTDSEAVAGRGVRPETPSIQDGQFFANGQRSGFDSLLYLRELMDQAGRNNAAE